MKSAEPLFSNDLISAKPLTVLPPTAISSPAAVIAAAVGKEALEKGERFAGEIARGFVADFEKSEALVAAGRVDKPDKMAHVSTFLRHDGYLYVTYYANTETAAEDPEHQTARLVCCPEDDPNDMTFFDVQTVGEICGGKKIGKVYDTILMQKDADTLYVLWTAEADGVYYRLYRPFSTVSKTLGPVGVNRFRVGNVTNDFSTTGMQNALAENDLPCKRMFNDIGIMQKLSSRDENGVKVFYTGAYSGEYNCIIKSKDLVTWEYVAAPDFPNRSVWENATYVIGDKCYYYVRQLEGDPHGFLTVYDLANGSWKRPVLIEDCQSRSDFLVRNGGLYLFYAPDDREHIGVVQVDTNNIAASRVLFKAKMPTSCFYPFVREYGDGCAMSYTVARRHIRLARFDFDAYL